MEVEGDRERTKFIADLFLDWFQEYTRLLKKKDLAETLEQKQKLEHEVIEVALWIETSFALVCLEWLELEKDIVVDTLIALSEMSFEQRSLWQVKVDWYNHESGKRSRFKARHKVPAETNGVVQNNSSRAA